MKEPSCKNFDSRDETELCACEAAGSEFSEGAEFLILASVESDGEQESWSA